MGPGQKGKKEQKPQFKPKPQCKQWKDMTPEERKAWCAYFKGKGPRPGGSPPIKFAA